MAPLLRSGESGRDACKPCAPSETSDPPCGATLPEARVPGRRRKWMLAPVLGIAPKTLLRTHVRDPTVAWLLGVSCDPQLYTWP